MRADPIPISRRVRRQPGRSPATEASCGQSYSLAILADTLAREPRIAAPKQYFPCAGVKLRTSGLAIACQEDAF
jgi:hypothetical protein